MQAAQLLANGMGGFDWAGLALVAGYLGCDDIEGLIDALRVIKAWRPPEPGDVPPGADDDFLNLG